MFLLYGLLLGYVCAKGVEVVKDLGLIYSGKHERTIDRQVRAEDFNQFWAVIEAVDRWEQTSEVTATQGTKFPFSEDASRWLRRVKSK